MKRFVQLVSVLFLSVSFIGCVSAKQRAQEQAGVGEEHPYDVRPGCGQRLQLHHESETGWNSCHPRGPGRFSRDPEGGRLVGGFHRPERLRALFLLPELPSDRATGEGVRADPRRDEVRGNGIAPVEAKAPPAKPAATPEVVHARADSGRETIERPEKAGQERVQGANHEQSGGCQGMPVPGELRPVPEGLQFQEASASRWEPGLHRGGEPGWRRHRRDEFCCHEAPKP